jgi:hypothetical protein
MGLDHPPLAEGWYLMSTADLEAELARLRGEDRPPSNARPLSTSEALSYRNGGNLPDQAGRTLRLVLRADGEGLAVRRRLYEPDFHEAPTWRRAGSVPVNVVPLRGAGSSPGDSGPWWEDPQLRRLEAEWGRSGTIAGLKVPGAYRGFVYKTVLALQANSQAVTIEAVADSIARWVPPRDAQLIRAALVEANSSSRS